MVSNIDSIGITTIGHRWTQIVRIFKIMG